MSMYRLQSSANAVFGLVSTAKANTQLAIEKSNSLEKGFTLANVPQAYPIAREVVREYAVDTFFRNAVPRVDFVGSLGFTYPVLRELNTNKVSGKVQDGRRGRFIQTNLEQVSYVFKIWGFENYITMNAQLASESMDVRSQGIAIVQETLSQMLSVEEEKKMIGGNLEALGLIESVTATVNTEVAGSLEAGDISVIAVPLTLEGLDKSSVEEGVQETHNEQNADGSVTRIVGGYGVKKTIAAAVTVAAGNSLDIKVEDVPDAVGYAIFAGAAGSERLVFVGSSNVFNLKEIPTDTQLASALAATDQSADVLDFNGIYALAGRNGGIVVSADGKELTAEGSYVPMFEDVIGQVRAKKARITHMVMDNITYTNYYKAVAKNIVNINSVNGSVVANFGSQVLTYTSPNNAGTITIIVSDYMPKGTIFFLDMGRANGTLGLSGNMLEMVMQEDFNVIAWPLVTRSWQFGIYCTGVLTHKYPASIAIIKNLKV